VLNVTLSMLGSFALTCDGRPVVLPGTTERLVAFLAVHPGRLPRIYVGASLWPDTSEQHARGNLRTALWRLNGLLGAVVEHDGSNLALDPVVDVDLHRVAAVAQGIVTGEIDCRDAPADCLLRARELLPGWYDDWVAQERDALRELRLHALEVLCRDLASAERFGPAIAAGRAAVAGDPLRESAHRVLVRAYLLEGNIATALRQYERCREVLADELGIGPSERMERLLGEHGLRSDQVRPALSAAS
jgi:DNA-binding SARP family transcriptional activator